MIKRSILLLAGVGVLQAGCRDGGKTAQATVVEPAGVVSPSAAVDPPLEPAPPRARLTAIEPKLNPEDLEPHGRIIRFVAPSEPSDDVEVLTQVAELEVQPPMRRPASSIVHTAHSAPSRNPAPNAADAPVRISVENSVPLATQPAPASTGGWKFFSFFHRRPKPVPIPTDPAPTPAAN